MLPSRTIGRISGSWTRASRCWTGSVILAGVYLDHNVSLDIVSPLRFAGHDVVTTRDLHFARQSDDKQLLTAVRAGRIVITHDRQDFTLLHDAWLTWPAAFAVEF